MEIIKNAVFARHGYAFKKQTYRSFFEQTDWYIPVPIMLTTSFHQWKKIMSLY